MAPLDDSRRCAEVIRLGFMDPALPSALRPIAARALSGDDPLFWQFPARTEASAWSDHQALAEAPLIGNTAHTYLGLPWATWVDLRKRQNGAPTEVINELFMQRVRIGGLRRALHQCGIRLCVHTVCQHIAWRSLISTWRDLGITDAWLSHAPPNCADASAAAAGVQLHPWRLYALNVEDASRREGLRIAVDPAAKPLLASFVGAHASGYLTDIRLRLLALAGEPDVRVHVTDRWHLEDFVYEGQIRGRKSMRECAAMAESAVGAYNQLLSDSVFSLCPAGTGPNTLRLWESLAVGSIPVILGTQPQLPRGGSLPCIDWDAIVLRATDDEVPSLPARLRAVPLEERRRRQALGLRAFDLVRAQLCFERRHGET